MAWDAFIGGPIATLLWPQMAAVRGRTHPHDAITLYQRLLPVAVDSGAGNARYDEALKSARHLQPADKAEGVSGVHRELEEIRETYRAKRHLIKLLATLS